MKLLRGFIYNNQTLRYYINEPEQCPICKKGIKPDLLHAEVSSDNSTKKYLSAFYSCPTCYKTFITLYYQPSVEHTEAGLIDISPNTFVEIKFEEAINKISPSFVNIYNQSANAESQKMTDIAGIGYRKAFEFLVKDYFLFLHSDEASQEIIRKLDLSKFFTDNNPFKIQNPSLNKLALASVWLGNDFSHYTRKHESYNLDDLKRLIKATIHHFVCELEVNNAEILLNSKNK